MIVLLQMAGWMPATAAAWFYERAAHLLGATATPVPALAIDMERNGLLKAMAFGAIFVMVRALGRRTFRPRLFLLFFVASAVLVMIYAITMQVTTNSCYVGGYLKKDGGYSSLTDACVMSGTFVNSNSFAAYLGMGIVAAVALIFAPRPRPRLVPHGYEEVEGVIASITGFRLTLLAICLFLLSGIRISASRAGFVSTLAGVGLAIGLLMRGRWRSRPELVRMLLAALALVLVVGLFASGALISKSMKTHEGGNRLDIWLAALHALRESPWLGWGLGSFADIYTVLQPPALTLANDLAHSTPLEILVELGVPGGFVSFALVLAVPSGRRVDCAISRSLPLRCRSCRFFTHSSISAFRCRPSRSPSAPCWPSAGRGHLPRRMEGKDNLPDGMHSIMITSGANVCRWDGVR